MSRNKNDKKKNQKHFISYNRTRTSLFKLTYILSVLCSICCFDQNFGWSHYFKSCYRTTFYFILLSLLRNNLRFSLNKYICSRLVSSAWKKNLQRLNSTVIKFLLSFHIFFNVKLSLKFAEIWQSGIEYCQCDLGFTLAFQTGANDYK